MTTKERIKEFLKYKKIGRHKFEEEVGVSSGYISTKSKTVTSDVIEKTYKLFPEINLDWLLTGEGEMIKEEYNIEISNSNNSQIGNTIGGYNVNLSTPEGANAKITDEGVTAALYHQSQQRVKALELENKNLKKQFSSLQEKYIKLLEGMAGLK